MGGAVPIASPPGQHRHTTCTGRTGGAPTRPALDIAITSGSANAMIIHRCPASRLGNRPAWVNHAVMPVVRMVTEPERHALIMPADCDCGMCAPTWACRRDRSRRFSEPVTLPTALSRENPAARPAMVAQHCACLSAMASAVSRLITAEPHGDLGSPGLGLPLVLFAGELAAALLPDQFRGELPDHLVQACEQTVTAATHAAAGCLAGLVETVQALSVLAGVGSTITAVT